MLDVLHVFINNYNVRFTPLFDIYTAKTYGVEPKCFYVYGTCENMGKECSKKHCNARRSCSSFIHSWWNYVVLWMPYWRWCDSMGRTTNSLTNKKFPNATCFVKYLKKHWLHKVAMWCVWNCNIPHVGQDTNASIEFYHANIKWILLCSKERLIGHKLDWLIYHLVGYVPTHY